MIDLLKRLLVIRSELRAIREQLQGYGYGNEEVPELKELERVERALFIRIEALDEALDE